MKTRRALLLLVLAAGLSAAQAQTGKWPEKPVRVVVPFPSGGTTDIVARMMTVRLAEEFGQQFVVDNRGGAGGMIGAEIAARANPEKSYLGSIRQSHASSRILTCRSGSERAARSPRPLHPRSSRARSPGTLPPGRKWSRRARSKSIDAIATLQTGPNRLRQSALLGGRSQA